MIMKDEIGQLERCIYYARPIVSEIIIVDTGSTDGSKELALKHKCRLYSTPWKDDFAAARNVSLSFALSDWILVLDPDEYISEKNYSLFRQHLFRREIPSYLLTTRNYTQNRALQGFIPNDGLYPSTVRFAGYSPSIKTRLFQRRYNFRFRGCWHELLDHDVVDAGLRSTPSPIPVHHYCDGSPNRTQAQRSALYLRLGRKKVIEQPNDGQAWNEYAVALSVAQYPLPSLIAFQRAVSLGHITPKIYQAMSQHSHMIGRPDLRQFYWEKMICAMSKHLTHFQPHLKAANPDCFALA